LVLQAKQKIKRRNYKIFGILLIIRKGIWEEKIKKMQFSKDNAI